MRAEWLSCNVEKVRRFKYPDHSSNLGMTFFALGYGRQIAVTDKSNIRVNGLSMQSDKSRMIKL